MALQAKSASEAGTSARKAPIAAATTAERLRVIPEDETFSRKLVWNAQDKTVTATFAVKANKDAKARYEVTTILDFSACSEEDIANLAADTAIIAVQRMWRTMANSKDAANAYDASKWRRIDVKSEIVDVERQRGPVDPVKATLANFSKLSAKDQADMVAKLEAMVKAAKS